MIPLVVAAALFGSTRLANQNCDSFGTLFGSSIVGAKGFLKSRVSIWEVPSALPPLVMTNFLNKRKMMNRLVEHFEHID